MCEVHDEERVLRQVLRDSNNVFMRTGSPNIICSLLPSHWRSNKQLPCSFKVVVLGEVADNTTVTLSAANEFNDRGDLKNNVSYIKQHVAVFQDLRFIGRSGRGRRFHVVITVGTCPSQVAVYRDAIKVTIDGPRSPRGKGAFKLNEKKVFERKRGSSHASLSSTLSPTLPCADTFALHQDLHKPTTSSFDCSNVSTDTHYSTTWIAPSPCISSSLPSSFFPLVSKAHSLSDDSDLSSQSTSPFIYPLRQPN